MTIVPEVDKIIVILNSENISFIFILDGIMQITYSKVLFFAFESGKF